MISQSYFGVIDVLNLQLTSLPHHVDADPDDEFIRFRSHDGGPMHDDYVALSYVWGKGVPYMTTLSNIMLHRDHGGLERFLPDLPRVIQDAIDLVRRLGVRYIWIDSLCIVQDSTRSWTLNAHAMDLIYGNAVLTICAADGVDSSAGLKAMHGKEQDFHQHQEECASRVRLMITRSPEAGIQASEWNKRAWTFQERLLSKRCLIFTEGRVYFQCRSTCMSEDIFADRKGAGWSLDLVHAPLLMLRELDHRAFWVYVKCVCLYTSRALTKPRDILAAFSGIGNCIEQAVHSPLIFGLPSSHFDLALLWEPQHALKRRMPKSKTEEGRKKKRSRTKERYKKEEEEYNGLDFPSWSWCGWMDATTDAAQNAKMEYKPDMVEGCLTNLNEWLINHTWIYWYIRDGHGNLRPVWNGERPAEDSLVGLTEKRWKGYRTRPKYQERPRSGRHYDREARDRRQFLVLPGTPSEHNNYDRNIEGRRRYTDDDGYHGNIHESRRRYADDNRDRPYDDYGRVVSEEIADKEQKRFHRTLPENPYRVVMARESFEPDPGLRDQPILQFWTWHACLHLVPSTHSPGLGHGLVRCDIADEVGDWCGSIVLDEEWLRKSELAKHEFIAISEAKAFTSDECDTWTYYIPKDRDQSEWDLYCVLLVERVSAKWERRALGKVFKEAFRNRQWKEIILG